METKLMPDNTKELKKISKEGTASKKEARISFYDKGTYEDLSKKEIKAVKAQCIKLVRVENTKIVLGSYSETEIIYFANMVVACFKDRDKLYKLLSKITETVSEITSVDVCYYDWHKNYKIADLNEDAIVEDWISEFMDDTDDAKKVVDRGW